MLTACTPGSAPGPTLGNKYGKPLPFLQPWMHLSTLVFKYCQHLQSIEDTSLPYSCSRNWPQNNVNIALNKLCVWVSVCSCVTGWHTAGAVGADNELIFKDESIWCKPSNVHLHLLCSSVAEGFQDWTLWRHWVHTTICSPHTPINASQVCLSFLSLDTSLLYVCWYIHTLPINMCG